MSSPFKLKFSEDIFNYKYRHQGAETWDQLSKTLVGEVCSRLNKHTQTEIAKAISEMKFIPGGRYLYYAGRARKFYNNCYVLKTEEDTREDWARISWSAENCLMTGGGIGVEYSTYRPSGSIIYSTGGTASGPIPKMQMVNEIGRHVMQGSSRRSAMYASLNCHHEDVHAFLTAKNWNSMKVPGTNGLTIGDLKAADFNYPAPLDMTNISVNYDTQWLETYRKTGNPGTVFTKNVRQALETGEPGFSFNFFSQEQETGRNAPVSGNTRILTRDGYITVKDIVNKEVCVWTGKQWVNTSFKKTASDIDTITVYLSNGRSITCDPHHPFIAKHYIGAGKSKKVTTERINAEDLEEGQKLRSDLPVMEVAEYSARNYALGFVFGDGSIRDGKIDVSYFVEDKKPCWDTLRALGDYTISGNRFYCSLDYQSFRSSGRGVYNNKSELFEDKLHTNPSFIAGWFDADGCWTRGLLRLSCSDLKSLLLLAEGLDMLGVQSVVRVDGFSGYKPSSESYTLQVLSGSLSRFSSVIPTKRLLLSIPENFKPYRDSEIRVVSVEPSGITEDVFCCDVKVSEHAFMAEGVLISNCTEITSADDSDVCNLGSINLARVETLDEFKSLVELATLFLLCGTLTAELPYEKVYRIREKNRRLGLGLMGVHEWLLRRGYRYEVTAELRRWLQHYRSRSNEAAKQWSNYLNISTPVATRAIAPTGTIGSLASTTTGIEPIYAVAYKRRYLRNGDKWHYQYVLDETANHLIKDLGVEPGSVETATDLATDYQRRIAFQADVQDYVDMAISSTINLPSWGSVTNNEGLVSEFSRVLASYAHRLRGFTCYPDGSRGGQPLTAVSYEEAKGNVGQEYVETPDICDITGKGGVCGV